MRAVSGPDPREFRCRYYSIPEADIGPKPMRPDGPSVVVGAASASALQRAGRLGVGLTLVIFDWGTVQRASRCFVRRQVPHVCLREENEAVREDLEDLVDEFDALQGGVLEPQVRVTVAEYLGDTDPQWPGYSHRRFYLINDRVRVAAHQRHLTEGCEIALEGP